LINKLNQTDPKVTDPKVNDAIVKINNNNNNNNAIVKINNNAKVTGFKVTDSKVTDPKVNDEFTDPKVVKLSKFYSNSETKIVILNNIEFIYNLENKLLFINKNSLNNLSNQEIYDSIENILTDLESINIKGFINNTRNLPIISDIFKLLNIDNLDNLRTAEMEMEMKIENLIDSEVSLSPDLNPDLSNNLTDNLGDKYK
jgi:hypothetical protein